MPRWARPCAKVSINECVMPAPAPWANTKQARGASGRSTSAETAPDFPASNDRSCVATSLIALAQSSQSITLRARLRPDRDRVLESTDRLRSLRDQRPKHRIRVASFGLRALDEVIAYHQRAVEWAGQGFEPACGVDRRADHCE